MRWQPLPDVTPEQREAAAIERLVDQVMAVYRLTGFAYYEDYETIRAMVVQELAARAAGAVTPYTFAVIPTEPHDLPGVPYEPHYTVVHPGWAPQGCPHTVQAGSERFAAIQAVIDHWRCIGR